MKKNKKVTVWKHLADFGKELIEMSKQEDKRGHFVLGFLVCLLAVCVSMVFVKLAVASILGFMASIIVGFAKEVWDYFHPKTHTVDVWDFMATVVGGLFGFVLVTTMQIVMLLWF